MFRQILCPIGNNYFLNQIARQNVNGVLESHVVARRNDKVTCPCYATPEPYHGMSGDYNNWDSAQTTCDTDDEKRNLVEIWERVKVRVVESVPEE
jgi:hypothetical protein